MRTLTELAERVTALCARPALPAQLPGLRVSRIDTVTQPTGTVTRPLLAIVAQGAKRTVLADRVYEYRAGQYLISTLDLPVTGQVTQASRACPFLGVGLPLDESIIAELILETDPVKPGDDPDTGIVTGDADAELVDAVVRLLRLIDSPREFAVLGPGVEREIHWRLLNGPAAPVVRKLAVSDSRASVVRRAATWITDHYDRTIRIADVADHVGVSEATLNRHFRAITAMSPLQYQKQIRLGRARVRLMAAPDDIAGVGHAVGYDSPSQFNREYRRMFGVPPGQDAVRLQGAVVYEDV
ncbi:MAG TPA: AraC family transcriptional regulator [Pseudonocardiaceae bacterium]|nr:AraC family transcriptional regulator [Pseudonocardiaceae bacterium]